MWLSTEDWCVLWTQRWMSWIVEASVIFANRSLSPVCSDEVRSLTLAPLGGEGSAGSAHRWQPSIEEGLMGSDRPGKWSLSRRDISDTNFLRQAPCAISSGKSEESQIHVSPALPLGAACKEKISESASPKHHITNVSMSWNYLRDSWAHFVSASFYSVAIIIRISLRYLLYDNKCNNVYFFSFWL